jgi:pimeloyl-ACP methyl ester carboxylesterase
MTRPAIRRAYANCRFGQLHFHVAKPEASGITAPTLILLHQNPSSSVEYSALIEDMARDRRVFAFDTPGYGMSDRPDAPQSIASYAAAIGDGIRALGLADAGPVDLYGFHTGTLLAIELAMEFGPEVGRLALTGIPLMTEEDRLARLEKARAVQPPSEDGEAIFERLRWLWGFTVTDRHPAVPIDRAAEIFAERARPLHRYGWAYEGVWTYPVAERLADMTHPVMVVQPDEMLTEHSRRAADIMPNALYVSLPQLNRDIFEPGAGLADLTRTVRQFLTATR